MLRVVAWVRQPDIRRDVVHRLAAIAQPQFVEQGTALGPAAAKYHADVAITELHDERGEPISPVVAALERAPIRVPVVVYDQLTPWRVDGLRRLVADRLVVDFVLRPSDQLARAVQNALKRTDQLPVWTALVSTPLLHEVPGDLELFLLTAAIMAPAHPSSAQLAVWSSSTLRTIERRLAKHRWATAQTIVRSIRALDIVWLVSEYGMTTRRVILVRPILDADSIRRLTKRYARVTPRQAFERASFARIAEAVIQRLLSPDRTAPA